MNSWYNGLDGDLLKRMQNSIYNCAAKEVENITSNGILQKISTYFFLDVFEELLLETLDFMVSMKHLLRKVLA